MWERSVKRWCEQHNEKLRKKLVGYDDAGIRIFKDPTMMVIVILDGQKEKIVF